MKKCPYCAEEIQDEAVKCKHCGEFLDESKRPFHQTPIPLPSANTLPWYFRTSWIVIVALSFPPLAIPMVYRHPTMANKWKVINLTVLVILSWLLWLSLIALWKLYKLLSTSSVDDLLELLQNLTIQG